MHRLLQQNRPTGDLAFSGVAQRLPAQSSTFKTTMAISVANHHDRDTAEIPDEEKGQSQTSQRGKRISAETVIAPFVTRGLMAFL
jgi:hypothetical protein